MNEILSHPPHEDDNNPSDPTIVEAVAAALYKWDSTPLKGHLPIYWEECDEDSREMWRRAARAAIEAVADDLRAEGAATALDLVRADIRAAALIRDYDPTRSMWTNLEVFEQAGIYTSEWLNDLLAYDAEGEQS